LLNFPPLLNKVGFVFLIFIFSFHSLQNSYTQLVAVCKPLLVTMSATRWSAKSEPYTFFLSIIGGQVLASSGFLST
jgi:hypothetical protein